MDWADPRVHPESNWFWLGLLAGGVTAGGLAGGRSGAIAGIVVVLVPFALWVCYLVAETVFLLRNG